MEKVYKNISKKISQGGSMMIEAMAMLALIALVTPTLYKKSAERTTELQDINTATHVRTLTKALDNYVSANYQALLEGELKTEDIHKINLKNADDLEKLAPYLPYGYKFEDLKNFDTPIVALKKKENENEIAITTFVQLPKKADIGEMRSARIASMIGSNGGYVDGSGAAKGVGGVWELDSNGLTNLDFTTEKGSVVVASSEAINSATSGALENEKYLQRTKVENENERWRNTMSTDLYMGGTKDPEGGISDMNSILGVERMIIGATESDKEYDLVLDGASEKGGSAYLAGDFSAASDLFQVAKDAGELLFGTDGDTIYAKAGDSVDFFRNGTDASVSFTQDAATINVATSINSTLDVTGDTSLVTDGGTFKAGPNGEYITANSGEVSLLNGAVTTTKAGSEGVSNLTSINTDLHVTGLSNFDQSVKIGTEESAPAQVENPILNVQGNAYVSKQLEVGEKVITPELDLLNLHAGGTDLGSEDRWLHATADGVKVTNLDDGNERLLIDNSTTKLVSKNQRGKLEFGDTNAILQGGELVDIYTEDTEGVVQLQNGALTLTHTTDSGDGNAVNINATSTIVNTVNFEIVTVGEDNTPTDYFKVLTGDNSETEILTKKTDITSERLNIEGNPLLQVRPAGYDGESARSVVGIDEDEFVVTSGLSYNTTGDSNWSEPREILRVDASNEALANIKGNMDNDASVYIRRGAIELEADKDNGSGFAADEGLGYVEASRFVSNATGGGDSIERPVYSGDYTQSVYYNGNKTDIDRYMVNPAYTSVMHDIKLTTRGGARLSDILPDFINKGIYVVTNTYKDNLNIDNLTGKISGGQVSVVDAEEIDFSKKDLSGPDQWASPFLGVVPAPQCPPGHARVITITPSGFMMSNTGDLLRQEALNPYTKKSEPRFVLSNQTSVNMNLFGNDAFLGTIGDNETILKPEYETVNIPGETETGTTKYLLGYSDDSYKLNPIYFQQSTWLKSKVIPQAKDVTGACNTNANECGSAFIGWSAIMGFLYHTNQYSSFINYATGKNEQGYYWNVFPVVTSSLEAYATVYCYFDRTNIYGSGNDSTYVDQYDQLNNFRGGYKKDGDGSTNIEYINRLNDPTLKYDNPW